ncbi:hypothetical protein ACJIZ3_020035 [Penstemon smallii]|uniref:Uncharacterized protein n=1 Tax=Penstemon smallii TaxID=265156 RepID=A0ABD3SHV9_9LAMI
MFASQLLKILQAIPSDVEYETRVFDSAEQDKAMKENQNATLSDAKRFEREADPLALESKEIFQLNGSKRDTNPLAFEINRGEGWNPFLDDFPMDNINGTRDSLRSENQSELSYHFNVLEKDTDSLSLSSDSIDKDKTIEHERSLKVEEFTQFNGNDSRDSSSETNLYTDNNALECELPEFLVCYKEINYHIVKDICVDEGSPVKDKILIDIGKNDQSDHSFLQPPNDNNLCKATEGGVDMELFIPDGLPASSLESTKGVNEDQCESKEEIYENSIAQGRLKSPQESSFDVDIAKHGELEDSVKLTDETNCSTNGNTMDNASKEESFIDKTLPIQNFGTRSFLRSFIGSLDFEDNTPTPDQMKAASRSPFASSKETDSKEDIQATSLLYKSKVESGSITFNFNAPAPMVAGTTTNSVNVFDQKGSNVDNFLEAPQGQFTSSNEISPEQFKNENSNDSSPTNEAQFISSKETNFKEPSSPAHKDVKSYDLSSDEPVQFQSSRRSPDNDGQAVESNVLKHNRRNSADVSVVSQLQHDEGEASFSAAGLITTYSEPIAFSGSLSHRSDGSTTSAKSFAFPVLQSEWNSSPVRMSKAERRHLRKHKGWRPGLCCRF